jgi:hypothetical protein
MKAFFCVFVLLFIPACHHRTEARRHSPPDCGLQEIQEIQLSPVGGLVAISPGLSYLLQQQLPPAAVVQDGCWMLYPGGQLEAKFERDQENITYVFEHRDMKWLLVATHTELVVGKRYGLE